MKVEINIPVPRMAWSIPDAEFNAMPFRKRWTIAAFTIAVMLLGILSGVTVLVSLVFFANKHPFIGGPIIFALVCAGFGLIAAQKTGG